MGTAESGPDLSHHDARRLLAACPLHAAVGLELVCWERGRTLFRFTPPTLCRTGETGVVHGGVLSMALDVAACFAAIAAVGQDCSTVDLRIDFLRPAVDPAFDVEGELRRVGRHLAWADAGLRTLQGRLLASARGLFAW